MHTSILALTATLAATSTAFNCNGNYFSFFNRGGSALSYQRLDPALFPGTQSPHLHSFDGGNGLSASTNFAATQDSQCSTARIKTDKSLYWRPTLFWNGNGTGFYRVPEQYTKIYYKFGDGDKWANVTGFPEDFNMIAGSPLKRSDGDNPAGVRWGCHQPDGRDEKIFTNGFPKGFQSCKYGFASEVTFPSCWNGKKLDPANPNAHMAYPSGYGGVGTENCPETHRAARFPTIFIEFWYDISSFDGQYDANSVPWVVSNGDSTGYGFHADFLNGWEKGVLEKATAQTGGCNCGCGCGQAEMEQCFGSENVNKNNDAAFEQCKVDGPSAEAQPVLDKLPGCNPIQSGPADATPVTGPDCAAATPKPSAGGNKPSASSPAVTPPAQASSKAASSAAEAYSSKVVKEETGTKPSVSLNLPNKGEASPTPAASSQGYADVPKDAEKPTPAVSLKPDTPKGTVPVSSAAAVKPSGAPAGGKGDCKAPVYVTVTPTIYVTAGTNSTACGLGTVTKTLTEIATVTVEPADGIQYGSY
ncbi:hypothetical protein FB567DRAFT_288193 [Paraphoma chrysanthemicola]|uniref:DUF1996 domain-containing protein n=1 Tax=Paraphoma chrysanthemicola TaxID=798071 RepID=A0A8K0RDB7_9PLEO|nr:hypothetical protein FB567DRAFT_288193 [Paraphoma chrysanthemicola]